MNTARVQGKVKFFNHEKGFGFITSPVQGGKDIFIHAKELPQGTKVDKGDTVAFETKDAPKGVMAINAELIEKGPQQPARPRRERDHEASY